MKQIRDTYRKTGRLHHAYGILGDRKKIKKELLAFLEKEMKFPVIGNPDFWQGDFNILKVSDSREINENHASKPIRYERKFFVISANGLTDQAQNALLKIFEEPRADTTFFLILPGGADLLATLKSRIIFAKAENFAEEQDAYSAETFLNAKVGKRMEMVAKIVKDIKDEKINKADAIKFIKNIEKEMRVRKGGLLAIEDLEKAISYASDESPSIKVILEHLANVV